MNINLFSAVWISPRASELSHSTSYGHSIGQTRNQQSTFILLGGMHRQSCVRGCFMFLKTCAQNTMKQSAPVNKATV